MSENYLEELVEYLRKAYDTQILENFLGLEIVRVEEGAITYSAKIKETQCNLYGSIHGGTLASIADVAMGVACITMGKRVVTIDMNTSYIKNAPAGSIVIAKGQVVSSGRSIMRAQCEIFCGEQLLVKAQASFYVTGEFSLEE